MPEGVFNRQIDDPVAWLGSELSPAEGTVALSASCIDELDAAAELLQDNPIPTETIRPDDFEFSACRDLMVEVRHQLDKGIGFALIDRLPAERYSRPVMTALYWLLATMVARPVSQKWEGRMIYDVRDTGQQPGNGVRPDITNVEQNFHTDNSYNLCPPEFVTLLCLQTAMVGGISSIVSFSAVHNEMRRRHPHLLPRLYEGYWFDRQREHAPGDDMTIRHPLFEYEGNRLRARLSRFQVVNGYKLAGETLDPEGEAALETLESIMNEPEFRKEFFFEPGQIQIVDNLRCGHRRTAFRDYDEPERKRHLVRLWLRDRGRVFYNG